MVRVATYSSLPMDELAVVETWPVGKAAAGWIAGHGARSTVGEADHPFDLE